MRMQHIPKVAIQGARGSFHDAAAHQLLPEHGQLDIICCDNFHQVFAHVADGTADYGVSAVENSLHGSINEVYRLLGRHDAFISRDIRMQIHMQLIATKSHSLAELQQMDDLQVLSQGPALSQVELWLDEHLPNATRVETHDTAASVATIMAAPEAHQVAVAGEAAATEYGGTIVARNIEDDPQNYTRFVLLEQAQREDSAINRAAIILQTGHEPGALLHALQIFEAHNSNLTKLDSHPIPGDQQHYAFYIDFEVTDARHAATITDELSSNGFRVKQLGLYEHLDS